MNVYAKQVMVSVVAGVVWLTGATADPSSSVKVESGGVTVDQFAQLNQRADDYTLELVRAAKGSGAYLADVDVSIRSLPAGDVVVEHRTEGPLMLVDLPPRTLRRRGPIRQRGGRLADHGRTHDRGAAAGHARNGDVLQHRRPGQSRLSGRTADAAMSRDLVLRKIVVVAASVPLIVLAGCSERARAGRGGRSVVAARVRCRRNDPRFDSGSARRPVGAACRRSAALGRHPRLRRPAADHGGRHAADDADPGTTADAAAHAGQRPLGRGQRQEVDAQAPHCRGSSSAPNLVRKDPA